jgi:hypothetical protein
MLRQATLGDVDFITGDYLAGPFLISVPAKLSRCYVQKANSQQR